MKTLTVKNRERVYRNNGQHAEYCVRCMFGADTRADNRAGGADIVIDGIGYQIKSFRATACRGADAENVLKDYADADGFMFVDIENEIAYTMSPAEFIEFVKRFGEISRESSGKNGGHIKIRLNRKFTEQREYLKERAR